MTKNIVIGVLTVMTVVSVIYAMGQRAIVAESKHIAEIASAEAQNQKRVAEEQRMIGEKNAMEARKQAEMAQVALMNCERSKKK